ncbi:zinc finger protein 518B [Dendrobates tinctorius]|uniref:zinc finger protein 518B n=1 Tax=Dendrobates tinctorius TaxID=92724 RepID=UPI003CC9DA9A
MMDSSYNVASFSVNQASQNNKYVTQKAFFCQQALNVGTESIMNNLFQNQIGEKFTCEKCRFSTKDQNKYRNHVSLHNDIKYTCSHCEFVSYTKTEFQRHLVSHTGKFPYTCGYCGYGAIRNDYIVKHIRRIHGDGKIQCSVSTVENESKEASVNIMQTQMATPKIENVLQNRSPSSAEDVIDLTSDVDSLGSSSNAFCPNGNNVSNQVEVEVIAPVDRPLYPWIPLTVSAPTSFKVPPNCIAEVVEVKSINSACHLVLKCVNLVESSVPNQPFHSDHTYDRKPLKPYIPSKNVIENPIGPSLQKCTVLRNESPEKLLFPSKTVCEPEKNLQSNETCPINSTSKIVNAVEDFAHEICDDLEEFSGGPIISAVFSLSSDSQNAIEGINWDCPNTSPSNDDVQSTHSFDVQSTHSSSKPLAGQEPPNVCSSESNCQMDIDKSQDLLENTASKSVKESSEVPVENVLQTVDAEIQLSVKSESTDGKEPESQPCVLQENMEGGRRSSRLGKMDINSFTKPQALFLSCDKRIVMEPLSCKMQNDKTISRVEVTRKLQVLVKMRKESAKAKVKRPVTPAMKKSFQPKLRTLRLHPVKMDQVNHIPSYNQPVVVLNHPDVETIEISYIMKAIRMFGGKVTKITLSKQKCV